MRTKFFVVFFVSIMALLGGTAAFAGLQIQHWTTDNGARVYFVPAPELPMIDLRVTFDAGAARDGADSGIALLTNALLSEGAGGLDAHQISERFESVGARFSNSAHRDMAVIGLRSLSDKQYLTPALETLTAIISQPEFPKEAFKRERSRMLIGLQQRKQSPGALADEAFYKTVYGTHPYASQPSGTEETVKALSPEKLHAFYQQYYVGRNAVIAIVGDLDRVAAEALAVRIIGKLPAGKPAAELPAVKDLAEAVEINIEHPSMQTHILLGTAGMKRGDPDYFPLYVGNHILGGSGLVARLSEEIREKRGLTYSAYSYFRPMRKKGPYTLGAQTRNASAGETLAVMRETLATFVTEGPSENELEAAKKNITGGFPLRISSNKKIIDYIGMIGFYGLPLDYLDTFNARVEAVTVADIKDAFQRRIHPDRMAIVMVGGKADNGE
ncbi:MAG TPA: insulinase family protein [Gammaproteobacteria bacterium]|nr:insulinase family protein [Gammaproteobacteria bacterium]